MSHVVSDPSHNLDGICANPLVSIIIACYNGAAFISKSIESALTQTYRNVEVVVVDDGSTDNSLDIISRYPVSYVHTNREGVSGARNHGVQKSRGEFVIFLDADDILLPDAAQVGVSVLLTHPKCCMAVGGHNLISPTGLILRRRDKPDGLHDYYARLLQSNFIECICAVVFRRRMVNRNQWFRPELRGAEDYDLYLHLARQYPLSCHPEVVSEYRMHGGNTSHRSEMMLRNTLDVMRDQVRHATGSSYRLLSYAYGLWFWRRKYGRQLTREFVFESHTRGFSSLPWKTLATAYPIGVPIALLARCLPLHVVAAAFRRDYALDVSDAHHDPTAS